MISRTLAAIRKDWKESGPEDRFMLVFIGIIVVVFLAIAGNAIYQHNYVVGDRVLVSQERRVYEIVGVDRPTHFQVSVRDVVSGSVRRDLNVSKHCNAWEKLRIGSRWTFTYTVWKTAISQEYTDNIDVKGLCDALRKL